MLKRAGAPELIEGIQKTITEASFPAPFYGGLEYSAPARGTWNIVHTGMLIPEAHEVFVCAYGCLRGVVLTAAEMNAMDRYSAIAIREENVLDGSMEELMVEGVADILNKLSYRPRAMLIYISCHHFFLAYDQKVVFDTLRERFPDVRFTDCYMIPTLRKSGITPDQKMRMQLYSFWEKPGVKNEKKLNHIGSNLPMWEGSELRSWLVKEGYDLWDLHRCNSFDEYLEMSQASLNLVYEPTALMGAEDLEKRLGMHYHYLSFSYDEEELDNEYLVLADYLGIDVPDFSREKEEARNALNRVARVLKDTPVAIDYTITFRPLSLAKRLLEAGVNVTCIYADVFVGDDKPVFEELKRDYPHLIIRPTNQPGMRFVHEEGAGKLLALGQKAAYFEATDYFVNLVESGGYFGHAGITKLCELIIEAYNEKKDRKSLIRKKGFGCESCL